MRRRVPLGLAGHAPTCSCSPTATRRSRSSDDPDYPARLEIDYPEHVDRWRPLVHWLLDPPVLHRRRRSCVYVAGHRRLHRRLRDPVHGGAARGHVRADPRSRCAGRCAASAYATVHGHEVPAVRVGRVARLLAQDLDHEPLRAAAVELAVEDRLPGAEVEPAGGHRDDHLVVDEQVLEVGVAVVLAAARGGGSRRGRVRARRRRRWPAASTTAARACRATRARRPGSRARRR